MIEAGDATKQKLLIENATIHNSQGYGVRIDSAKVQIYNSQITNCLKHPLYVEGGASFRGEKFARNGLS